MTLLDSGQHCLETNRIGIEYWTAVPYGKPVAVHVYNVDIRGAKCDTLGKHVRASFTSTKMQRSTISSG